MESLLVRCLLGLLACWCTVGMVYGQRAESRPVGAQRVNRLPQQAKPDYHTARLVTLRASQTRLKARLVAGIEPNYLCSGLKPATAREAADSGEEAALRVTMTPNPLPADGWLRASVQGADGQPLRASLISLRGDVIRNQDWPSVSGEHLIEWDLNRQPTGMYLLRVQTTTGLPQTVKVVKP